MNTYKPEAKTYLNLMGDFGDGLHEEYKDTIALEYNVHLSNYVEYSQRITLTREQAEILYTQLGNKLFGFES